jgi:parallel beta-helix repeat protein
MGFVNIIRAMTSLRVFFLFCVFLLLVVNVVSAEDIFISGSDGVWNIGLNTTPAGALDSSEAVPVNFDSEIFVKEANAVWNIGLNTTPSGALDSSEAVPVNFDSEIFVKEANAVWNIPMTPYTGLPPTPLPTIGSVHNINKGTNYATIQATINDANPGDEIHVDSGTYYENVNVNKRLILKGIDMGSGKPVVDASNNGTAIALAVDNITLEGFIAVNESVGWPGAGINIVSSNNVVENNSAFNNRNGIYLANSIGNKLKNNNVTNNLQSGILLDSNSNNNLLEGNEALFNAAEGISIYYGSGNLLIANKASNNIYGIGVYYSNNNIVIRNNVSVNSNNGITLGNSHSNSIYHNNLSGNPHNGYDDSATANSWDNGYPSGGNYWSDYTGVDLKSGVNQDQPGNDGIGDTPYNISGGAGAQDRYPLMAPYTLPIPATISPWPMYGHDVRRTGQSEYVGASKSEVKWNFSNASSAPIIGPDGTIYVGQYAINPNGSQKWNLISPSFDGAAIDKDGTIYTGYAVQNLWAINPNGTLKWIFKSGSKVDTGSPHPVIGSNAIVYVPLLVNYTPLVYYPLVWKLFAIYANNGTESWNYTVTGSFSQAPALDFDNTVYLCLTGSGSNGLYAIKEGILKWKYIQPIRSCGSPSISSDGTIYIQTDMGLYAINPNNTLKWRASYTADPIANNMPAISNDGTIHVISGNKIFAIYPNGTQKWNFSSINNFASELSIGLDGVIYIGSNDVYAQSIDHKFYAINPDGSLKWNYSAEEYSFSQPAIDSDGTVYVGAYGSNGGKLYAFGSRTPPTPPPSPSPTPTATEDQAPNQPTELNQFKSDGITQITIAGATDESTIVFSGKVSDPDGDKVKLQVELRRLDEYGGNFDETQGGLKNSSLVTSGGKASISASDLLDGNYHWRARTIDEHEKASEWVSFGGNPDSVNDFIVTAGLLTKIRKQIAMPLFNQPYLLDPNSFDTAVGSIWMLGFDKSKANEYDKYYYDGIYYRSLRLSSLTKALAFAKKGEATKADEYLNAAEGYRENADISFGNAYNVYISSLTNGIFVAKEIRDYSQIAFKAGVTVAGYPAAGQALDGAFIVSDWVIDRNIDPGQANKDALTSLVFLGITEGINFPELGNQNINDYLTSRDVWGEAGKDVFPAIQLALQNNNAESQVIYGILKEAIPDISVELSTYIGDQIKDNIIEGLNPNSNPTQQINLHSPGELRVYDSNGNVTGLVMGKIIEDIPNSIYDAENKSVTILEANDTYRYEVVGTDTGEYGLDILSVRGIEYNPISLRNTIIPNEVHQYIVDWNNFSKDKVIALNIDSNNDGVFDKNVKIQLPTSLFAYTYLTNQHVNFDGSSSKGNIISYKWDFGDGTNASGKTVDHTYREGDYAVTLTVENDNGGFDSRTRNIRIDLTPPTTTATLSGTLGNNSWYISNVQVNLTATDNVGGSGVNTTEYSFDNTTWNIYTAPFNITNEGTTTVYYYSTDNASNVEPTKNQTIEIDKIPPNITISGVNGGNYYNYNVTPVINITDTNLYNQSITLNGAPFANGTIISAEGNFTLVASATDLAGNNASKTVNFKIDKTPPEADIRFNTTSKDIEIYDNEIGTEASYIILPTKKGKDGKVMPDNDGETGWEYRQYTLKDLAGNSLALVLEHKKEGKEAKVKVLSAQYNGGKVLTEVKNKMQADYSVEKNGALKDLEQDIEVKKLFTIDATYNAEKNKTEIVVKPEGQKPQKETKKGIVILELLTDKGGLKSRY